MDKVFLTIRKVTVAPVMAVLLLFVVRIPWARLLSEADAVVVRAGMHKCCRILHRIILQHYCLWIYDST